MFPTKMILVPHWNFAAVIPAVATRTEIVGIFACDKLFCDEFAFTLIHRFAILALGKDRLGEVFLSVFTDRCSDTLSGAHISVIGRPFVRPNVDFPVYPVRDLVN